MNYEVQNTEKEEFFPQFMGANEAEVGRRGRCVIDGSQPTETATVRPMRTARPPKKRRLNPLFDRCYTCEVMHTTKPDSSSLFLFHPVSTSL